MDEPRTGPLPAPTLTSWPFWKSGADGRLRFPKCVSCNELRHPSLPVCPYCHAADVEQVEVSGEAVVAAFTVNQIGRASCRERV